MTTRLCVLLLSLFTAAGLHHDSTRTIELQSNDTNSSATETKKTGCGHIPPRPHSSETHFIDILISSDKIDRRAKLYVPSGYQPDKKYPLVMSFHDFTSTASLQSSLDDFVTLADKEGFLVVYPEGLDDVPEGWNKEPPVFYPAASWQSWNGAGSTGSPGREGPICNASAAQHDEYPCYNSCGKCADTCWWATCTDDVSFVNNLLDTLEKQLCVNTNHVYAVGNGNGGKLIYELGSHKDVAHRFEAVAAVAGLPNVGFPRHTLPKEHVPRFLGIWGEYDKVVPPLPNRIGHPDNSVSLDEFYFLTAWKTTRAWLNAHGLKWNDTTKSAVHNLQGSFGVPDCTSMSEGLPVRVANCIWQGEHAWPRFATRHIWNFLHHGAISNSKFPAPSSKPGSGLGPREP